VKIFVASEKLKESQNECASLRKQVGDLTRNLHEQQDFIFSMQTRQQQITGSEAAAEFTSLYGSVEEWVERNLGDALYDRRLENEKVTIGTSAKEFLRLITLPGQEAFRVANTDVYNVVAAIMRFISSNIFDHDFYCPIEQGHMEFFKSLQKSTANLQPRRG
jgi:hypothetical protein